jgi:hypothetical protein
LDDDPVGSNGKTIATWSTADLVHVLKNDVNKTN